MAVVVGVNVDETGRDEGTIRVEGLARSARDTPDLRDEAAVDRYVCRASRSSGPVDTRTL